MSRRKEGGVERRKGGTKDKLFIKYSVVTMMWTCHIWNYTRIQHAMEIAGRILTPRCVFEKLEGG